MSVATESTPMEVPQPEVTPVVAEPAPPSAVSDEPSPKKAKVEEQSEPPIKPVRKSRQSGGLSIAERTRKEAEAILKDFKDSPDGGRRTRSATRGTPAPSPVQTSPRAPRKPREATPVVKNTAPVEKKPASGGRGRGRGRGRPPKKGVKAEEVAGEAEEVDGQGEEVDADANNGTETTSSDVPSAAPVTENGIDGESHEEPTPPAEPKVSAPVEETKVADVPSPTDPWAEEAKKPTPPSDPWAAEAAASSQPSAAATSSEPVAVPAE